MNLRGRRCALLAVAVALGQGKMAVAETATGIVGVTKGPADVSVPPDVPEGEVQHYGLGFPFQVGPTMAAIFVNRRMEVTGLWDFENGSDVILFDNLGAISADAPIPVTRNEKRVDPATGERRITVKFPDIGGFVPLGARRADGSRHPRAGSGFAICQALEFPMTEAGTFSWSAKWKQNLEFHQFAFDGNKLRVVKTETWTEDRPLMIGDTGWYVIAPGITMAIPDGDDLLQPVLAANRSTGGASGIVRWRTRYGIWRPVSFVPVADGVAEASLIRDADGALLFSGRGSGPAANSIPVWRSGDNGATWQQLMDVLQVREEAPISINRAADGTPYIATNPLGHGRQVLQLWPLNAARTGLEEPIVARAAVEGRTQTVDHPNAATVRLADGKWHHVLVYRVMNGEDPTGATPDVQTGCCVEEVFSRGPAIPAWDFAD
jgi:hypothetical protein